MSCGQVTDTDNVCAADRLGRLLNRARSADADTGADNPSNTSSHLHTPDDGSHDEMASSPACAGHGCDLCATCLGGSCCVGSPASMESMDRELAPVPEVHR